MRQTSATPATPSIRALFTGFLVLGLTGFGGVLPLARAMIVERRRWMDAAAFTDLLGLCQFLPGGNVINLSVAIGLRFHGARGAVAALAGLLAAPVAIVVGLGAVYDRYQGEPAVRHLFAGLAAAAAGVLTSMALKILRPLRARPVHLAIVGAFVMALAVLRLPLLPTMLVLAPAAILGTWATRGAPP